MKSTSHLCRHAVPGKQSARADWPKPHKHRHKPPATANKRPTEQIRKILGKHYASKYRARYAIAVLESSTARGREKMRRMAAWATATLYDKLKIKPLARRSACLDRTTQ